MKITTSKVKAVNIEEQERLVQVLQFGPKTADEAGPFGIDSSPPNDLTAIYADTGNIQEPVIVGYINNKQIAQQGEIRLYSLDENGQVQSFVWLKNNGDLQLNGDTHNTVRYSPLESVLSTLETTINANLAAISTAIGSIGGTYTPTNVSIDISAAENDKVKIS